MEGSPGVDSPAAGPGKLCLQDVPWVLKSPSYGMGQNLNIWGINVHNLGELPSGELTKSYGKSPFLIGKSAISMAIFNCYVSSPEGTIYDVPFEWQG